MKKVSTVIARQGCVELFINSPMHVNAKLPQSVSVTASDTLTVTWEEPFKWAHKSYSGSREVHFFWTSSARVLSDSRRSSPTVADPRPKNPRNEEKVR